LQKGWKEADGAIRWGASMGRLEGIVVGVVAAGILLVSVRRSFEVRALRAENAELRKEVGMLEAERAGLEGLRRNDEERFSGSCGDSEADRRRREHLELLRLRGEVGLLRRQVEEQRTKREAEARTERIEINSGGNGPRVQVSYDPAVWKRWEPEVPSESVGPPNQRIWDLKGTDFVQVQVRTVNETKSAEDFRRDQLLAQTMRGDAAELVRERRQVFGGSEWMVLEFYNGNTRPPRTEIKYFLGAPGGSVTVSVVGTAEIFANYRGVVEGFLGRMRVISD
jgi:hypothetical protein